MDDKVLLTTRLPAGTAIELRKSVTIEFNSPMVIKIAYRDSPSVAYNPSTVIELVGNIVLSFTLDKEACHESRQATPIPQAPIAD